MYAHRLRRGLTTFCIALALTTASGASAQTPLPAGLDAGPHAVGFRIQTLTDPSRPTGPRLPADQRSDRRARVLRVHVWYPAASMGDGALGAAATGASLTISDYIQVSNPPGAKPGAFAATHRLDVNRFMGLTVTDAEWAQYTSYVLTARREAPAAPGPFPLLIGMLRPVSMAVAAEHLASHGYVVALVERQPEFLIADGAVREGLIMAEHIRDMQMAISRLREIASVDDRRLGAIGFSGDGLAQLALGMRHPDVDAVVQLESGWVAPSGQSSYQSVAAFEPTALRAPLFFAYSENLGRNTLPQLAEITNMRYAPRYLLYFGEPRMTHLDFATEGAVLAMTLERRQDARASVTRAFLATYRYQRRFLDAFVKDDAVAMAALTQVPGPRTVGALIELTSLPAVAPALTRTEFRALLDGDVAKAIDRAREDLSSDPKADVFDEGWLNAQAYDASLRSQTERAIALFTLATEAYPRSANAWDSLSDILERLGRKAEALAAAEKALATLPGDTTVPAAQHQALSDGLRARIARLKT